MFNNKGANMVDILKVYFHIRAKMRDSQVLNGFFYHGWLHTKSFYDAICYLAALEDINDKDLEKLKIAALYHDTGYTTGKSEGHEYKSAEIVHNELSSFGVEECDIEHICRLIVSTTPGYRSNGILEEIMQDADFEYLGRDYYPHVSELLRKEKHISENVWKAEQISFLKKHQFTTMSARILFDNQKDVNYRKLLNDE
jgi:uncharacterized protein